MNERATSTHRIHSIITRSTILHVEDALGIGKVRLRLYQYTRGEGASAQVSHYVDLEDARVLFHDLAAGRLSDTFTDYKGTPEGRDGQPLSRVLRVEDRGDDQRNPIVIEISEGPGEIIGQGAVKPKGKPDTRIAIFLDRWNARRLGHAVLAHLQAWEVITFRERRKGRARQEVHEETAPYSTEDA